MKIEYIVKYDPKLDVTNFNLKIVTEDGTTTQESTAYLGDLTTDRVYKRSILASLCNDIDLTAIDNIDLVISWIDYELARLSDIDINYKSAYIEKWDKTVYSLDITINDLKVSSCDSTFGSEHETEEFISSIKNYLFDIMDKSKLTPWMVRILDKIIGE